MSRRLLLVCALALAAAEPVSGQDFRIAPVIPRTGFGPYVEFGGSVSGESTSCAECAGASQITVGLRSGGGWQFSPRVRVGVEVLGSFSKDEWALQNLSHVLLTGQVGVTDRLHVRLGIGPARLTQGAIIEGETTVVSASGTGWMVGVGTELALSSSLVLAPTATLRGLGGTDLERDGSLIANDQSFRVFEFGLGIRYHFRHLLWPNPRDRAPA